MLELTKISNKTEVIVKNAKNTIKSNHDWLIMRTYDPSGNV